MNNTSVCRNASGDFITSDYWTLGEEYGVQGTTLGLFLMLFISVGLPWNGAIVITIFKEKLYNQPTIVLLFGLILTAILNLVFPTVILAITGLAGEFILGASDAQRCKLCHLDWALSFTFYNFFFVMAIMAVNRLVYIGKPLQYERLVDTHAAWITVLVTFLVSLTFGLVFFAVQYGEFIPVLLFCSRNHPLTYFTGVTIAISASTVTVISNIWFFLIVLRNIRDVYGNQNEDRNKKISLLCLKNKSKTTYFRKKTRLFVTAGALILSTLIIWLPFMGSTIASAAMGGSDHSTLSTILAWMVYCQTLIHPAIETLLIPDVRRPLLHLVTCGLLGRKTGTLNLDICHRCFSTPIIVFKINCKMANL